MRRIEQLADAVGQRVIRGSWHLCAETIDQVRPTADTQPSLERNATLISCVIKYGTGRA